MDNQNISEHNHEFKLFAILLAILAVIAVYTTVVGLRVKRGNVSVPSQTAEVPPIQVSVMAKSAYVVDLRTGKVLYAKNENEPLPLASLTKVMSALVALDYSPSFGTLTVAPEALETEGDSGLLVEEKWSLKDILDFSLTSSSNDGMHAVALALGALLDSNITSTQAEEDFVQAMNTKAKILGLNKTRFFNETGLDISNTDNDDEAGAYGSAVDMNTLFTYVLVTHPELLSGTRYPATTLYSLDGKKHDALNTNTIVSELPNLLASKTGLTDLAGGNLLFAFDPELGRPIVVSILGSTETGRFEDAKILTNAVMKYLNTAGTTETQ